MSCHRAHLFTVAFTWLTLCGCSGDFASEAPALKASLRSADSKERNRAALRIASYGPAAKEITPEVIRLLADPNGGVRSSAAYALREIDTAEAKKALDAYQK